MSALPRRFNRSTQHPCTYLAHWNGYANGTASTDVGHAEAKGKALRALEEQPMGGRRRPTARETKTVYKSWLSMEELLQRHGWSVSE